MRHALSVAEERHPWRHRTLTQLSRRICLALKRLLTQLLWICILGAVVHIRLRSNESYI